MALAFGVLPMKAVPGALPTDERGWAYEIKWDGQRIVAFVDGRGGVRLQSANGREITGTYPELAGLADACRGRAAILDGEVVALDAHGRPSFASLQHRMHVSGRAEVARRAVEVPVALQLFDLLSFDGTDAIELPYDDRRRLLGEVVQPGPSWSVPANHLGGGAHLLAVVREGGLEGLVAKRRDSLYTPGRRSTAWRKVKVRRHQELVIGGWAPGEGARRDRPGSFLLGYIEGGAWRYAGRVGTGFTGAELDRLSRLLAGHVRPTCPFDPPPPPAQRTGVTWVEPIVVVEVAYGEWTPDGLLRHPAYLGQRDDKDPAEVTRAP